MLYCRFCSYSHPTMLAPFHIKKHGISSTEYKSLFPDDILRIQTPESRAKSSATKTGKPNLALREHERTEEHSKNISKSLTEGFATGKIIHWNTGRTTPDDVCEKIAEGNRKSALIRWGEKKPKPELRCITVVPASFEEANEIITSELLTKLGKLNAAITRREKFINGAFYQWILEQTKDMKETTCAGRIAAVRAGIPICSICNIKPLAYYNSLLKTCGDEKCIRDSTKAGVSAFAKLNGRSEKQKVWVQNNLPNLQKKGRETLMANYGVSCPFLIPHVRAAASAAQGTPENLYNRRVAMEAAGYWTPLDQLPALITYKYKVWYITNKNVHLIPGYDPTKRGRHSKTEDNWQIDHRLSITQGFAQGVTPEQMGHRVNLRFIPWRENLAKFNRSDLTKEELLVLIKETEVE